MHVFGRRDAGEGRSVSTEVWQYRQSMPLPPTCRSWLNWMGWFAARNALVFQDELCMA